ncbi:kinase-like protein [Serendipita vermifera]|nr:kinase-like protein [Serendipita vermifera]
MLSRRGSKRESPPSQWKSALSRIFGLGSKSKTRKSKSSSVDVRVDTQPPVESGFLGTIRLGRSNTIGRAESKFGTLPRPIPSYFADSSRQGSSRSGSSSRGPFHYPPLNAHPHAQVSLRSVVTTLSPSSEGHGHEPTQDSYEGMMITRFSVTFNPSPLQRYDSFPAGIDSERGGDQSDARPEPQEPPSGAPQSARPRRSQNPEAATLSSKSSLPGSLYQDGPPPLDLSGLVQKLDKRPIFEGTYSRVFAGDYNGTKVAVKEVRMIISSRTTDRKFQRELRTWWKLRHPNILPLLGYIHEDESNDIYRALVSPWMEGGTAADYIKLDLSPLQRLLLFGDVINGLQYLHNFNPVIVHADLKPANVLITREGGGKICDFGLIHLFQEEINTGMTTTTAHTGTTRYLAYELVRNMGEAKPTTASDVYALGCIGMEFIFCHPPHRKCGDRVFEIMKRIGEGVRPAELPSDDSGDLALLWSLLNSCWAHYPIQRPEVDDVQAWFQLNRGRVLSGLQAISQ